MLNFILICSPTPLFRGWLEIITCSPANGSQWRIFFWVFGIILYLFHWVDDGTLIEHSNMDLISTIELGFCLWSWFWLFADHHEWESENMDIEWLVIWNSMEKIQIRFLFVFTFWIINDRIHCLWYVQIVGTSKNFEKKRKILPEKKHLLMAVSDSDDSYSSGSHLRQLSNHNNIRIHSFTPSTPPPTAASFRTAKRRKGIPHRAPMGGLIIEC